MKGIFVAWTWLIAIAYGAEPPVCLSDAAGQCGSARAALLSAQAAVQEASRLKALWTTAQSALGDAEAAFARADYCASVRAAAEAEELARLGIAQRSYPPLPAPKP